MLLLNGSSSGYNQNIGWLSQKILKGTVMQRRRQPGNNPSGSPQQGKDKYCSSTAAFGDKMAKQFMDIKCLDAANNFHLQFLSKRTDC